MDGLKLSRSDREKLMEKYEPEESKAMKRLADATVKNARKLADIDMVKAIRDLRGQQD